ncbi:MAG: peptide chain release factor N(5)-glutamine methyltransferase [Gloeomargaritaceae cyanobacterium C42_A2020_066]|nr:peptide chain release factor N(5)-glutamine methyltransferase [Gloeomargaritaceae cyanobacterium C42_A2020_066]
MVNGLGVNLWAWWRQTRAALTQADQQSLDWLVQELTGLDALDLHLGYLREPVIATQGHPTDVATLASLWARHCQERVPVQYLAGRTSWRDFQLQVGPGVLIPRPETEQLVDLAVAAARPAGLDRGDWLDLGTGSGAIALGVGRELPRVTVHAVDRSPAALTIAQANARNLGLTNRIQFYTGDWFEPLAHLRGRVQALLANPPYIPTEDLAHLQPEIAHHEPRLALDGGSDGLDSLRVLVTQGWRYLRPGGLWAVETMAGQPPYVVDLLRATGHYRDLRTYTDWAGQERFVLATVGTGDRTSS